MPHPLEDLDLVDRLGEDLRRAGYDSGGVPDRLGEQAHRALGRAEFAPALRATSSRDALDVMIRLFLLGTSESETAVAQAFPTIGLERAVKIGAFALADGKVLAALDIRPHADEDNEFLIVSDLDSDTRPGPVRHDHVLGVGAASITLARAVIREPVNRVLDLGTGCGIQSVHSWSHAGSIVGTDTNPRALALAAATARLNGQEWDLRLGSLFDPVAGEQFELIVSNPPFVVGRGQQEYIYRDSGMAGDGLCEALIRRAGRYLAPGGTGQLLANWIVRENSDWRERVGSWVQASGLDAWVVQRELADPAEYVALWGKDAGETGQQAIDSASDWLDYFASERVAGIGMGLITLRRNDSASPDIVLDEITGAGEDVIGAEAAAFLARRQYVLAATDEHLLATRLSLADSVILEQRSLAGHEGWMTVLRMLRRSGGPGATLQLDEWGQALMAGCTGALPLAVLLDLLAQAHELDLAALTEAVLPSIRVAITRGILHPVDQYPANVHPVRQ